MKRVRKMEREVEIAEELPSGWAQIDRGLYGWYACECETCEPEMCEPVLELVVRDVYKPGERLAIYVGNQKVADGDKEVIKFLKLRGIPLPFVD
jgi:hypothetical protein